MLPTPPPTIQDLILPTPLPLSTLLTSLRTSTTTPSNRLHSIAHDAQFVTAVAAAYGRPVVANERCGSWYVEPQLKKGSAYFKSTDGHAGAWKFSLRRVNVHLVGMIEENDGIIIVDSTRRGKKMPDALSKTIPIWCAVLNAVLFPRPTLHPLHVPPTLISPSEASLITSLLPTFVSNLTTIAPSLNITALRQKITKPLRPLWVTPDSPLLEEVPEAGGIFAKFRPVICLTASGRAERGEMAGGWYVQGAADDAEMWAGRLTAEGFWRNREVLLGASDGELPGLMKRLAEAEDGLEGEGEEEVPLTYITDRIAVGRLPTSPPFPPPTPGTASIYLPATPSPPSPSSSTSTIITIPLGKHKLASKSLRHHLSPLTTFAITFFTTHPITGTLAIYCPTGKDISVGVGLAVDCFVFDDDGTVKGNMARQEHTKIRIRGRLGRVMVRAPGVNPSRNTLQSVNSFLMG